MGKHNIFGDIDPLVLMTAMLIGAKERASKPPPPPTPGQIERRRIIDERNAWNEKVTACKAAKKLTK